MYRSERGAKMRRLLPLALAGCLVISTCAEAISLAAFDDEMLPAPVRVVYSCQKGASGSGSTALYTLPAGRGLKDRIARESPHHGMPVQVARIASFGRRSCVTILQTLPVCHPVAKRYSPTQCR